MKKFKATGTYTLISAADNAREAQVSALIALHDTIRELVDYIPEEEEEKRLEQAFKWEVTEIKEKPDESQLTDKEQAEKFIAEYLELCKKYGLCVESDSHGQPVVVSGKNSYRVSLHSKKITIV
jgi:hypothetical protein